MEKKHLEALAIYARIIYGAYYKCISVTSVIADVECYAKHHGLTVRQLLDSIYEHKEWCKSFC